MNQSIVKGSIVKYKDGWMRATAVFKRHANLGNVFGSKTIIKSVPLTQVYEDEANWYEYWRTTEGYRSM